MSWWWGHSETDASLSSGVLGVRLLALSAVAGAVVLLPAVEANDRSLILGVTAAATLAALQHLGVRKRGFASLPLVLPQVGVWAFLIHATGGHASPFALGYLLEPPLAGLLFGPLGLVATAISVALCSLSFPEIFPLNGGALSRLLWLALLAVFTAVSGHVVLAIRRRRELAARSQRALQEEMSLLVESLSGALVVVDDRGRIETLNLAAATLLGPGGTAVGKPWQEVLRIDPQARDRVLESLATGTIQRNLPVTLENHAGQRNAMRAEIWISPGVEARRTFILLEAEPSGSREDPMRRLGEAAACVAHQIKNSVHALQGMAQAEGGAGEYQEGLRSLGALAEDVLAFSGQARGESQALAVQDAVRAACVLLGHAPIRFRAPEAPLRVRAHRGQLVHAIFNLLDNARRVTPPGSHVDVRARSEEGWVTLEIVDRGPGISPTIAAARGPVASEGGSGLGLLAARRWVERNGGCLKIGAAKGRGTICRLTLPCAGDERVPGQEPAPMPLPAASAP